MRERRRHPMTSTVKPIPEGYHTATPYLTVHDGTRALEFYKQAFGAQVMVRMDGPEGKVGHAEIQIGDSRIMLADEFPNMGAKSAQTLGGSPVAVLLYVEDVDALFRQAVAAGAKEDRPVEDQFYGDRMGSVVDPYGHRWLIATHKEDVSPEEMKRRMAEMMAPK
jgi:PhnB protein